MLHEKLTSRQLRSRLSLVSPAIFITLITRFQAFTSLREKTVEQLSESMGKHLHDLTALIAVMTVVVAMAIKIFSQFKDCLSTMHNASASIWRGFSRYFNILVLSTIKY